MTIIKVVVIAILTFYILEKVKKRKVSKENDINIVCKEKENKNEKILYQEFIDFVETFNLENSIEYISIDLEKDDNLTLFDSKIGGVPYISRNEGAILDVDGDPMFLLAQINCSELPKNDIYPSAGLVQFYITANDLYGLELENKQNLGIGHRVVYISETEMDSRVTKDEVNIKYALDKDKYDELPIDKNISLKMNFKINKQAGNYVDIFFSRLFINKYNEHFNENVESLYDLPDKYCDYITDKICDSTTQIGGYAFFTQEDIRENNYEEYDTLLLQIEYDDKYISWGDAGVANFFITKKDLENKDFNNVLYNWDCY